MDFKSSECIKRSLVWALPKELGSSKKEAAMNFLRFASLPHRFFFWNFSFKAHTQEIGKESLKDFNLSTMYI